VHRIDHFKIFKQSKTEVLKPLRIKGVQNTIMQFCIKLKFLHKQQELVLLFTLEGSVVIVLFYNTQSSSTAICLFLKNKA